MGRLWAGLVAVLKNSHKWLASSSGSPEPGLKAS